MAQWKHSSFQGGNLYGGKIMCEKRKKIRPNHQSQLNSMFSKFTHTYGSSPNAHCSHCTKWITILIKWISSRVAIGPMPISHEHAFRCSAVRPLWEATYTLESAYELRQQQQRAEKKMVISFAVCFFVVFCSLVRHLVDSFVTIVVVVVVMCVYVLLMCVDSFRLILPIFIFRRRIQWMFDTCIYFVVAAFTRRCELILWLIRLLLLLLLLLMLPVH